NLDNSGFGERSKTGSGFNRPRTDVYHVIPHGAEVFDVRREVERAISLARSAIEPHARLELSLAAKVPPIEGEEGRLWHAVLNVLKNATTAVMLAEGDSHVIEVDLVTFDNAVVVRVVDSGIGIPADVVAQVFDGFFSAWPNERGSGLGLTVVRDTLIELG